MKKILVTLFLGFIILGYTAIPAIAYGGDNEKDNRYKSPTGSATDDREDDDNSGSDDDSEDDGETELKTRERTRLDSEEERDELRKRVRDQLRQEFKKEVRLPDGRRIEIERKIEIDGDRIKILIIRKITMPDGTVKIIETRIERDRNGDTEDIEIEGEEVGLSEGVEIDDLFEDGEGELEAVASESKVKIKVRPDRVRSAVRERFKGNVSNLTLEEIKHRNIPRVVYKVNSEHPGRFLGIIEMRLRAETQVDPETGEVLAVNVPWWIFLVTGTDLPDEEDVVSDEDIGEVSINLVEQNNSSESGTATLVESDGQVTVTLSMTGFTQDVSQPAHIHVGSCPDVGGISYPLTNVLNGESVTILGVTLSQLESELPLAVNVHKSAEEASVYTACGDLIFE
jgi:hypothetical protein